MLTPKTMTDPSLRALLSQLVPSADDSTLDQLVVASSRRTYRRGHVVFAGGHPCEGVVLIESGLVGLVLEEDEERPQLAGLRGPMRELGLAAWLTGGSYRHTALPLQTSRVVFVAGAALDKVVTDTPRLAIDLARRVAAERNELLERLQYLTQPLRARIAYVLLSFFGDQEPTKGACERELTLPVTRTELASLVGVAPESVSRALTAMCDEGLIELEGRRVVIRDAWGLARARAGRGRPRLPRRSREEEE